MYAKHLLLALLFSSSSLQASTTLKPLDANQCKRDLKGEAKTVCLKALQDDPEAQLTLGRLYAGQEDPKLTNYRQAFYWHRRLARLADQQQLMDPVYSETMYNTGVFYAEGLGTKQNHNKALFWFTRAANRGDGIAMFRLAVIYSEGIGVAANLKTSLDWLNKAVAADNANAKVLLAQLYSEGKLVKQDNQIAIKLLREAAQQNSPNANFALGNFYLHGLGVDVNLLMAKNLFGTACGLNLLEACKAYYDIDSQQEDKLLTPDTDIQLN